MWVNEWLCLCVHVHTVCVSYVTYRLFWVWTWGWGIPSAPEWVFATASASVTTCGTQLRPATSRTPSLCASTTTTRRTASTVQEMARELSLGHRYTLGDCQVGVVVVVFFNWLYCCHIPCLEYISCSAVCWKWCYCICSHPSDIIILCPLQVERLHVNSISSPHTESAGQGTLTTQENFKGCIRNIVLNSERRDWTDMYKLQNVLLSACPIQ